MGSSLCMEIFCALCIFPDGEKSVLTLSLTAIYGVRLRCNPFFTGGDLLKIRIMKVEKGQF